MENIKHIHKDVVVTRKDGELVVTSRQIARDFEKRHADVLRDIEVYKNRISTTQFCTLFIESEYRASNGKMNKEYLLTRDGFSFLVMGFTGVKADEWKLKYIEAFNKMEQAVMNPYQGLSKELQAIFLVDQKQQEIDTRVSKLENTMTIDYAQQENLNRCARERLVKILGGKESKAYKELSKKVFSSLWNKYKQVFNVNSYKNTAIKDYERAIDFILNWEPSKETSYMIIGANSQVSF